MARVRNPMIRMQKVTILHPPGDKDAGHHLAEILRQAGQSPGRLGMARVIPMAPKRTKTVQR